MKVQSKTCHVFMHSLASYPQPWISFWVIPFASEHHQSCWVTQQDIFLTDKGQTWLLEEGRRADSCGLVRRASFVTSSCWCVTTQTSQENSENVNTHPTAQHHNLFREVNKLNWNRERVTLDKSLQQPVPLCTLKLSFFACSFSGSPGLGAQLGTGLTRSLHLELGAFGCKDRARSNKWCKVQHTKSLIYTFSLQFQYNFINKSLMEHKQSNIKAPNLQEYLERERGLGTKEMKVLEL